ncbi:EAL domain-containing protein [Halomonas sp.]|uniref:EAL domain-containing protein n=1 Tax=Halomonas sp. TaxID=1486246 RepID=UPI00384DED87
MASDDNKPPPEGKRGGQASPVALHPVALAGLGFENAQVGIAITDAVGKLRAANTCFRSLLGIPSDLALAGIDIVTLLPLGSALFMASSQWDPSEWHEIYLADVEGNEADLLLSVTALEADASRLLTLVPRSLVAHGIHTRDALTRLGSPSLFQDRLIHALTRAERHGHPLAILLMELDPSPRRAGLVHWQRWRLLEQVTQRLQRVLRKEDSLARLGEGRWGVIIEHPLTPQSLQTVALRLAEAMDAPFESEFADRLMTLSIGIARFPEDAEDITGLISEASQALAQTRRHGPGSHAFRDSRLGKHLEAHVAFLMQLHEALLSPSRHFHLLFQPQCDALTGRWVGIEALVRWSRTRHGTVYPSQLLPAIEELGESIRLDRWVLEQVIQQRSTWQASGLGLASLPLGVNLMAETLDQDVFDGCPLDHFLQRYPQALEGICLEFPASVIEGLVDHHRHLLKRLQQMGIGLVVDGLGTSPVSLVTLPALGLSGAKLAPAMMTEMEHGKLVLEGVRGLLAGMRALGIPTVAVGVETAEQLARVKQLGIESIQGHVFCPPLTAGELAARWEHIK